MPQAAIEKLDAPTRVKLRSSQILTSLPQIVSELVQNSLDAGATHIDIGADCEEWICWVKDDGHGISKEGLSLLGSGAEEGRYGSSKTYQSDALNALSTFGFRGEALASAADLACLEISSRTANSRETWSTISKGGKNLYSGPAVRWRRESRGTVVCIRDAFYNLPVRRLSHPPPGRTLELIRQELETYALVFPNVAFTLENSHDEAGPSTGRVVRIPKTSSSLASFRNLYGRALTEHVDSIELSSGSLKLNGFISLSGAHSKGYQFLYVNRHPIARCDLHHVIDSTFASSSFGKNALDEMGEMDLPRSTIRRSPRKIEKRPVYVLDLTVPTADLDNCMEPAKAFIQLRQRDAVVSLLSSSVESFLTRHGFRTSAPSKSQLGSNRNSPSPRKRRRLDFEDDSAYGEKLDINNVPRTEVGGEIHTDRRAVDLFTVEVGGEDAQDITWTDPNTGETFVVDPRTGNSHALAEPLRGKADGLVEDHSSRRRTIHTKDTFFTETTTKPDVPHWLQNALQANRTFDIAEVSVPRLHSFSSSFLQTAPKHSLADPCDDQQARSHQAPRADVFGVTADLSPHRFEKQDLRRAKVINQVDRKFIACLIGNHLDAQDSVNPRPPGDESTGPALVLIDQHAADERVRVERFLKDICNGYLVNREDTQARAIRLQELSPPRPLLLTLHEAQGLKESRAIQESFRQWGFDFDLSDHEHINPDDASDEASGDTGYTQVLVKSIPEVVSDKLLIGDELRDLVKGFLGQLVTETLPMSQIVSAEECERKDEFSWLKALRWCPRELLELINSKACRGAIMFNDSLSIAQCETLVQRLSETAFPFQCAHGRPSLVPLTNLGAAAGRNKGISLEEWESRDLAGPRL